ncbi:hypothetical protein [Actinosynnema sp. NPDC020468]|uniref:hypothetical protein n=1 Tax=Actinosynnema sp. NPDC020468 TaxID=3154488 RepID=UPI0033C8EED8
MSQPPGHHSFPLPGSSTRQSAPDASAEPAEESPAARPNRKVPVALVAAGAAFAAVTAVVVVVAVRGDQHAAAALPTTNLVLPTYPAPSTTTRRTTTTTTTAVTPTTSSPSSASSASGRTTTRSPSAVRRVSGPAGISVELPADWPVEDGTIPSNVQADNPRVPGDLVRFGGSPAPAEPLLDTVAANETQNPNTTPGYQRIRLARGSGAGEVVEWEFLYRRDGRPMHGFARYWRVAGTEYIVYGTGGTATWTDMRAVVDAVVRSATPT